MQIEVLEVKLSEQELKERSAALAEKVKELEAANSERKEVAAELKERCDDIENQVSLLAGVVRRKAEDRAVECSELRSPNRAVVDLIRADTGEIVRSRPMTAEEVMDARQVRLFEAPRGADEILDDIVTAATKPKRHRKAGGGETEA